MTTIVIDGGYLGRSKGELIDSAFSICGLSSAEYEIQPEETILALKRLNGMLAQWEADGLLLGYNGPDYLDGNAAERSGIAAADEEAVVGMLALRLAPHIGKQIAPEVRADIDRAYRSLLNRNATIPSQITAYHTPRGTGHRRRTLFINYGG